MRVVRIIVAVMVAAIITVTGCTTAPPSADQPAPPPPAPNPTYAPRPSTPQTDPNDPVPVDRQAPIYTAVLRQYLTSGDHSFGDHRFPEVFVLDDTAAGAGGLGHGAPGAGPIPRGVQRAITHALTDVGSLTFVASPDAVIENPHGCADVRGDGILVTLGPVDGSGDRVRVGINGFRACLGANSLTYLVEWTGRGWAVSGITAHGPVA